MANRCPNPNAFAGTSAPWSLAQLDQNSTFFQGTFNDASVGFVNGIPTDTGTLNAYSVTVPLGAPSAYQAGMYVVFIPLTTNTGAATLTVSPLGSQVILDEYGNPLGANAIAAGRKTIVIHDGTNFCLINNALAGPPIGSITIFGGVTAPFGWLLCNGAGVSTTTYANLFAVIGYNFGGAGASFNLPNFSYAFPFGATGTPGATGGSNTIAISQLPAHSHTITDLQHSHSYTTIVTAGTIPGGGAVGLGAATTGASYTGITGTNNTGSGAGYLPPYVSVHFIIKT
jgi:microcystin-dependent protein